MNSFNDVLPYLVLSVPNHHWLWLGKSHSHIFFPIGIYIDILFYYLPLLIRRLSFNRIKGFTKIQKHLLGGFVLFGCFSISILIVCRWSMLLKSIQNLFHWLVCGKLISLFFHNNLGKEFVQKGKVGCRNLYWNPTSSAFHMWCHIPLSFFRFSCLWKVLIRLLIFQEGLQSLCYRWRCSSHLEGKSLKA